MDVIPLPEYQEDIRNPYNNIDQCFTAAITVVERLGWQIVSRDKPLIVCHVPGAETSRGESVTITISALLVTFYSRSVDEYQLAHDPNAANALLFKETLDAVIEAHHQAEKDIKFFKPANLKALIPSRQYLVTPLLVYANVVTFIVMICCGVHPFTPETSDLLKWGANARPMVVEGQWWRLFSCMFLHAGIFHLLMNMFALLYIGIFLEPLLGKARFLAAYLLTGICASVASVVVHPLTVSVGASGAIFGMYGVFAAMLTTKLIERTVRKTILQSILYFIVLNLLNGVKGNIDNAAHVGGLFSGLVIGYAFYPGLLYGHRIGKQLGVTSIVAVLVLLVTTISIRNLNDDFALYQEKMTKFMLHQSMALEVFHMRADAPKEDILYNLKDRGIYYWNENKAVLDEADKLDIPDGLKERDEKLRRYCDMCINLYQMMYRKVDKDDSSLNGQIAVKEQEIKDLQDSIKIKSN